VYTALTAFAGSHIVFANRFIIKNYLYLSIKHEANEASCLIAFEEKQK